MSDSTDTEKRYVAKIMQTVEVCVEQFDSLDQQPLTGTPEEVEAQVQEFIDEKKDMGDSDYRIVVEELEAVTAGKGEEETEESDES